MSGRFAVLNAESSSKKVPKEKIQENSKGNVFKQKSRTKSNISPLVAPGSSRTLDELTKPANRKTTSYSNNRDGVSKNLFAGRSKYTAKTPEFVMQKDLFPSLNNNSIKTAELESTESYKNKIQKHKEENTPKITVPIGYIILTKNKPSSFNNKTTQQPEYSEYYNPAISRLIMENRLYEREELNDILGDISPYWNMDIEYDNNTQEYDDTTYSDDEDDDYVEDW